MEHQNEREIEENNGFIYVFYHGTRDNISNESHVPVLFNEERVASYLDSMSGSSGMWQPRKATEIERAVGMTIEELEAYRIWKIKQ